MEHKGIVHSTAEKAFQYEKSVHHNKDDISAKILSCDNPAEIKNLTKHIELDTAWKSKAKNVMMSVCMSKFQMNPKLRQHLFETGNTLIVESSPDPIWGSGVHLRNPRALDVNAWKGSNELGQILMEIRDSLGAEVKDRHKST